MKLKELFEKINTLPTIMSDSVEYDLLDKMAILNCDEIEKDEENFVDLIKRITYSYEENYLENAGKNNNFLNWARNIEEKTTKDRIRIFIVEAIISFTDDLDEARTYITTERGKEILEDE